MSDPTISTNPQGQRSSLFKAGSTTLRESQINPQSSIITIMVERSSPAGKIWESIKPPETGSGDIYKLNIMFMDEFDSGITESSQPEYVGSKVVGRAEEFKSYAGTSNRELNLKCKFRVQGLESYSSVQAAIEREVLNPAKWLDALKYPIIDDQGIARNPPSVILTIGKLLTMRCIVTKADVSWQAPWDVESMYPFGADVDCTFTSVSAKIGNYSFGNERFAPVSNAGGGYTR